MKNIIIIDDSEILQKFISNCFQDCIIKLLQPQNAPEVFDTSEESILLINTSIVNSEYRFRFERGGLEFVKNNLSRFPENQRIIFFSYEGKENIKQYLKDNWLKYDSKYFLHYPFEKDIVMQVISASKPAALKTTEMFKIEIRRNLLKILSSVKHDFLNRIARILPDLKAYRSLCINGRAPDDFKLDFNHEYLRIEITKLAEKISFDISRNGLNYSPAVKNELKELAGLLQRMPDTIDLFKNKRSAETVTPDLELFIESIENIKNKFENITGYLSDEQR